MKKPVLYLSGPIAGCSDKQAKDWRSEVIGQLWDQYTILNPALMSSPKEGWSRSDGESIVAMDKIMIHASRHILVNAWKITPGTMGELALAAEWNKIIYVVLPLSSPLTYHPWIAVANSIYFRLQDAIDQLVLDAGSK